MSDQQSQPCVTHQGIGVCIASKRWKFLPFKKRVMVGFDCKNCEATIR